MEGDVPRPSPQPSPPHSPPLSPPLPPHSPPHSPPLSPPLPPHSPPLSKPRLEGDAWEEFLEMAPPGFRFTPTDGELVTHYLLRKANKQPVPFPICYVSNFIESNPVELPVTHESIERSYFFTKKPLQYPLGCKEAKVTAGGFWKQLSGPKIIQKAGEQLGMKRILKFWTGTNDHAASTWWRLDEYSSQEGGDLLLMRLWYNEAAEAAAAAAVAAVAAAAAAEVTERAENAEGGVELGVPSELTQ